MSLPKSVTILSVVYAVDVVTPDSGEGATMKAGGTLGRCDYTNRRIIVVDGEQPADMLQTLLHEMVHATLDMLGMHDDWGEGQVTAFAAVYTDALLRNEMVGCAVGLAADDIAEAVP